jgi:hypothetical protein
MARVGENPPRGKETLMYRVIRAGELRPSPGGTVTFEGEPFGSGVSFSV